MNNLAAIVSDALIGETKKTIYMGGRYLTVSAPATCVLARMLKPLSMIDVQENERLIDLISKSAFQSKYIDSAIAYAVIGDTRSGFLRRLKHWRFCRLFSHSTATERESAFAEIISLVDGKSFFFSARLAMEISRVMARQESSAEER